MHCKLLNSDIYSIMLGNDGDMKSWGVRICKSISALAFNDKKQILATNITMKIIEIIYKGICS